MQIVGGLLAFPFMLGLITLGIAKAPLWVPAVGALVGIFIGYLVRPNVANSFARSWYSGQIGGIVELAATLYAMNLIFAAILYGIGRAIGSIL